MKWIKIILWVTAANVIFRVAHQHIGFASEFTYGLAAGLTIFTIIYYKQIFFK
jgi:hypothetical protein